MAIFTWGENCCHGDRLGTQGVGSTSKHHYKKHKIYLYKEDFAEFNEMLKTATDYILNEKGLEVISERHQKNYKKPSEVNSEEKTTENFTDVNFEDI